MATTREQRRGIEEIQPDMLYPISEAAEFVPSPWGGHVSPKTLHAWRREGRLACVGHRKATYTHWFVWGSELLRVLQADDRPEWLGRTPAQEAAAYRAACAELERHGISLDGSA